jgi:hypothetical protein
MAKQKNTGKAETKNKNDNAVFIEIKALLAHLIEIVERIDKRISGGF